MNLFDYDTGEAVWLAAAGRRRVRVGAGVRFPLALMGDLDGLRRGEAQTIDVRALPPSSRRQRAPRGRRAGLPWSCPMISDGELIGG